MSSPEPWFPPSFLLSNPFFSKDFRFCIVNLGITYSRIIFYPCYSFSSHHQTFELCLECYDLWHLLQYCKKWKRVGCQELYSLASDQHDYLPSGFSWSKTPVEMDSHSARTTSPQGRLKIGKFLQLAGLFSFSLYCSFFGQFLGWFCRSHMQHLWFSPGNSVLSWVFSPSFHKVRMLLKSLICNY